MNYTLSKISTFFAFVSVVSVIYSAIELYDLFMDIINHDDPSFMVYVLIAIPLLFGGITATLIALNKITAAQTISTMQMIDSKKPEKD